MRVRAMSLAVVLLTSAEASAQAPPAAPPQPSAPAGLVAEPFGTPPAATAMPPGPPLGPPPGPPPTHAAPPAAGSPPAGPPASADRGGGPSAGPNAARPTSVEEYARLRRRLKVELKTAERRDREPEADRLRREIETVEDWYREDVERRSVGAFAGGVVMISLGGTSLLTSLGFLIATEATDAAGTRQSTTDALRVSGGVTLLSGVALLGGGIPLAVWGGTRVMADDGGASASPPPTTVSSSGALAIGPGGAHVSGSF